MSVDRPPSPFISPPHQRWSIYRCGWRLWLVVSGVWPVWPVVCVFVRSQCSVAWLGDSRGDRKSLWVSGPNKPNPAHATETMVSKRHVPPAHKGAKLHAAKPSPLGLMVQKLQQCQKFHSPHGSPRLEQCCPAQQCCPAIGQSIVLLLSNRE